jgi:Flp pilus assembly protein TadB
MRGPAITVSCECGELRHVPYGETWVCERCGRRWNTKQIPADEYWGILRSLRRERLVVIAVALALALVFGLLAIVVSTGLFLLLPLVLGAWFVWYLPLWRRKLRRRVRNLPRWTLDPE